MKKITSSVVTITLLAFGLGGLLWQVQPVAAQESTSTTYGELSSVDIDSMLLMREEEKLSRDVYVVMYDTYGAQIFLNIYESESTHFDQMGVLLERYGLEDPALEAGVFTDQHIQDLYDLLITMGMSSLEGAYRVGAIIEEVDILDFLHFLANEELDNKDIRQVYTDLMNASENHLRGYVSCLLSLGVVYEPAYLSLTQYEAILAEETSGVGNTAGH
jgi:hypothetical protein